MTTPPYPPFSVFITYSFCSLLSEVQNFSESRQCHFNTRYVPSIPASRPETNPSLRTACLPYFLKDQYVVIGLKKKKEKGRKQRIPRVNTLTPTRIHIPFSNERFSKDVQESANEEGQRASAIPRRPGGDVRSRPPRKVQLPTWSGPVDRVL